MPSLDSFMFNTHIMSVIRISRSFLTTNARFKWVSLSYCPLNFEKRLLRLPKTLGKFYRITKNKKTMCIYTFKICPRCMKLWKNQPPPRLIKLIPILKYDCSPTRLDQLSLLEKKWNASRITKSTCVCFDVISHTHYACNDGRWIWLVLA